MEVCAGRCLGGHCDAVWRMVTGTLRTRQRNQAEAATLQTSAHCLASRYNIRDTNGISSLESRQDGDGTLRTLQRNQAEAATLQTTAHCLASWYNIRDTNGISRHNMLDIQSSPSHSNTILYLNSITYTYTLRQNWIILRMNTKCITSLAFIPL